jgi:hypothetical protein
MYELKEGAIKARKTTNNTNSLFIIEFGIFKQRELLQV